MVTPDFSTSINHDLAAPTSQTKPQWRKVLYERTPLEDNYVDASFLENLRKNISTPIYDLPTVVRRACLVSRLLSCVALFVATFLALSLGDAEPLVVLTVVTVGVILGVILLRLVSGDGVFRAFLAAPKLAFEGAPYLALCYGLSPVLITLTRTISEDTLYAMTTAMLMCYLIGYDYSASASMVSSPVSLNAALFASVCLASRLPSILHTFVIVFVAIVAFALWPVLHRQLCSSTPLMFHDALTAFLTGASVGAILRFSGVGAVLLCVLHWVVIIVCPTIFVRLQKDKHNIHGPWDEAVIKD